MISKGVIRYRATINISLSDNIISLTAFNLTRNEIPCETNNIPNPVINNSDIAR